MGNLRRPVSWLTDTTLALALALALAAGFGGCRAHNGGEAKDKPNAPAAGRESEGAAAGASEPPSEPPSGGLLSEPGPAVLAPSAGPPGAPAPSPTSREKSLFDGNSLRGWSGKPGLWSVEEGAIGANGDAGDGTLLITDGDYDNFRLILESKLVSEDNHLGVCFWGGRSESFDYADCLLVIPPNGGMWDYQPGKKAPREGRTNLPHPDFDPHDWHRTEILANLEAGTVRMAVNGVEVLRYVEPDPSRFRKGPIGLQMHAGESQVRYRNISIELNPPEDRLMTLLFP